MVWPIRSCVTFKSSKSCRKRQRMFFDNGCGIGSRMTETSIEVRSKKSKFLFSILFEVLSVIKYYLTTLNEWALWSPEAPA